MVRTFVVTMALGVAACGGDEAASPDAGRAEDAAAPHEPDATPPRPDASEGADAAPTVDATLPDAAPCGSGTEPHADSGCGTQPREAPDAAPPAPTGRPRFAMPIHPDDRQYIRRSPIFGVDHDSEAFSGGERWRCRNYAGRQFPFCYDQHEGSDFMLAGDFDRMDAGSARIVAAAGGEVVRVEDGHYDRCHGSLDDFDVTCDGHPKVANRVHVRHALGWETEYLHLKNGSVTVAVGDRVRCGDVLGLVGSSGNSTAPHLHFEVRGPDGALWDPFAGPASQPDSLWAEQAAGDGLPSDACDAAWGPP